MATSVSDLGSSKVWEKPFCALSSNGFCIVGDEVGLLLHVGKALDQLLCPGPEPLQLIAHQKTSGPKS